jgi:hypothetical protein
VLSGLFGGAILPSAIYKYVAQPHLCIAMIGTFICSGLAIHHIKKLDRKPGTEGSKTSSQRTKRFLKMTLATLTFLILLNCPFLLVT